MESRSGRRLRRSQPPPPQHEADDPHGDDRISALPDDMLLQVLVRLRCARAAARTDLLSRRWRGLWARLPGLIFRDIPVGEIKSALARIARRTSVSFIEIRLSRSMPWEEGKLDDARAKSLLRAVARFSPEEFVFVLPQCPPVFKPGRAVTMVLPCFSRATSIHLDTSSLRIMSPPAGELPLLEMLSISGNIVGVGALLNRCPRLRVIGVTFRGVEPGSLQVELAKLEAATKHGLVVSRLGIDFGDTARRHSVDASRFASLLHVAARLSPRELQCTNTFHGHVDADLLCFHRATSIELNLYPLRFIKLPDGEFSALERLDLNGCTIADLVTMIIRCPRLRVLKVAAASSAGDVMVHSVSLEELELAVHGGTTCQSIHIVTPLLKQLKLKIYGKTNLGVSISAPVVEKVSWWRQYILWPLIFGFWWLQSLRLETVESYKHKDEEGQHRQLPHVLSMDICSDNHMGGVAVDLAREMEKLLVTNFSVLELHLNTKWHLFGAIVLRLLMMHHTRTNIRKLKIVLPGWFQMPQAAECLGSCPCDEPKDWRSQTIYLTRLEEVEINNFTGGDHEVEFLTLIFGWAPMLTRLTIKLASKITQSEIEGCATSIQDISAAYPSVNCFVYLSYGEKLWCPSGLQA